MKCNCFSDASRRSGNDSYPIFERQFLSSEQRETKQRNFTPNGFQDRV
uniref:Uncharacterized protein n=1 Tax=Solanum lycopersicum TaxID=4081 RepID=A0A3Q7HIB2_SOLLC